MTTTSSPTRAFSYFLFLLTLTLAIGVTRASVSRCPDGHYRDGHSHRCLSCSKCPVNQIIRRPCTDHSNTLCGPFSEFLEFHQAPRPSLEVGDLPLPGDEIGEGEFLGRKGDTRNLDDNRSRKLTPSAPSGEEGEEDQGESSEQVRHGHNNHHHRKNAKWHHRTRQGQKDPESPDSVGSEASPALRIPSEDGIEEDPRLQDREEEEEENQWKVLALALIVVLCVVCVFLIVFVFVVCYMRSRRAHLKQVFYSTDTGSRSLGGSRPLRAMTYLPVLTHTQVTASASGSAIPTPPGGLAGSSYLYSEDYDADNSGQTISTSKSSDYVYFKSPHNGNHVYDV